MRDTPSPRHKKNKKKNKKKQKKKQQQQQEKQKNNMSCFCHAFASVHCCLVVTCWERSDLLALVRDVKMFFVTFLCGILGQVWYLIVSIPDLSRLSYL